MPRGKEFKAVENTMRKGIGGKGDALCPVRSDRQCPGVGNNLYFYYTCFEIVLAVRFFKPVIEAEILAFILPPCKGVG